VDPGKTPDGSDEGFDGSVTMSTAPRKPLFRNVAIGLAATAVLAWIVVDDVQLHGYGVVVFADGARSHVGYNGRTNSVEWTVWGRDDYLVPSICVSAGGETGAFVGDDVLFWSPP